MKKNIYTSLIFILFFILFIKNSSAQSFKEQLFAAYTSGNVQVWETALQKAKIERKVFDLEIIVGEYGLIAFYLNKGKIDDAERLLDELEPVLEKGIQKFPNSASFLAIRAALFGYRISISPYKAPFLGAKSSGYMQRALSADKGNPYVQCELANSLFYRPSMFGGSKTEAIVHYEQCVNFMEKNADNSQNWYYLNALTTLGQSYEKTGQMQKAKAVYEKALRYAPNFVWLKTQLYPNFLKKLNEK